MKVRAAAFLLFFFVSAGIRSEQTFRLDVQQSRLDNGLKILIFQRHDSPTFAAETVYRVGSVNECPGITGMAHLLEHLMFKGTETIGTEDYERELSLLRRIDEAELLLCEEKLKGDISEVRRLEEMLKQLQNEHRKFVAKDEIFEIYLKNGAVGLGARSEADYTHYFCALPSNRLELWCLVESDRMRSPVFRELYAERDVIVEERRQQVENDPGRFLFEQLIAAAFVAHPYQQPGIGWISDVSAIRLSDVETFWRTHYGPNNSTIVLAGDVYPETALPMIEQYFGDIPPRPMPEPIRTIEPEQRGERITKVESEAEPMAYIAYHKPAIGHPDQYVFDIIEALLSRGRTSRLYRSLILDKQIAVHASAHGGPDKYPGLFIFVLVPRYPHSVGEVVSALDAEIERLASELVGEQELHKVKNGLLADFIRRLESNSSLASEIALYEGLLSWNYINTLVDRRDSVTATDIRRVVQHYFIVSNRTIAELVRVRG